MSNIIKYQKPFSIIPTTIEEAINYAEKIARSNLCPPSYKNKPDDVLIAMQMGAEVGLAPLQSLQNIAVINGRPCIYGDAAIAIVRVHPTCRGVKEWIEGDIEKGTAVAYCAVTRVNEEPQIRSFSIVDATRAKLWQKPGPWVQYPLRMLQMRARGFALRDVFPDALKGLNIAEEIIDLPEQILSHQKQPIDKGINGLKMQLGLSKKQENENAQVHIETNDEYSLIDSSTGEIIQDEESNDHGIPTMDDVKTMIASSSNIKELMEAADIARSLPANEKKIIAPFYKEKQAQLNN